jgi:hypothetical protein
MNKGGQVLALIVSRMAPQAQLAWITFCAANQAAPAEGPDNVEGFPFCWTNANDTHPYGPILLRTRVGHARDASYPTMRQWLLETYPDGTPSVIPPPVTKLNKVDWSDAKFDGKPENVAEWIQKIEATKKANRIPDVIPTRFGTQITEAIAQRFKGMAAHAWMNTPDNQKPTQIGTADVNNTDQTNIIAWVRHRFQSHTLAIAKQRELETIKWDQREPLNVYVERFNQLLRDAGYTPPNDCPENIKIDFFLHSLPYALEEKVHTQMDAQLELARHLGDLWQQNQPGQEFTKTLRMAQVLAVDAQTTYELRVT